MQRADIAILPSNKFSPISINININLSVLHTLPGPDTNSWKNPMNVAVSYEKCEPKTRLVNLEGTDQPTKNISMIEGV